MNSNSLGLYLWNSCVTWIREHIPLEKFKVCFLIMSLTIFGCPVCFSQYLGHTYTKDDSLSDIQMYLDSYILSGISTGVKPKSCLAIPKMLLNPQHLTYQNWQTKQNKTQMQKTLHFITLDSSLLLGFDFLSIFFNITLFIFGSSGSSLLCRLFSSGGEWGYSRFSAWAFHCGGFSCCRAWACRLQQL